MVLSFKMSIHPKSVPFFLDKLTIDILVLELLI